MLKQYSKSDKPKCPSAKLKPARYNAKWRNYRLIRRKQQMTYKRVAHLYKNCRRSCNVWAKALRHATKNARVYWKSWNVVHKRLQHCKSSLQNHVNVLQDYNKTCRTAPSS